jgi:hypothetical protein
MTDTDVRARVAGMIMGCWPTRVIFVAVRLRLFERLAQAPRGAADLAAETGSHPDALRRLMRALAVLGLVRQTDADLFELAPAGRLLLPDTPGSIRGLALHWGDRLWGALSQLEQSVKTGKAWRISGAEGFEHMARDPEQMAMFHQSMADQTGPVAAAILEAYDFSRFSRIIDVGGSTGALLAAVLKAYPRLEGQVYDLPDLAAAAGAYLEGAGVADRGAFIGGSFFEQVPAGADTLMMKMIIHDWEDEEAALILTNCRKALGPGGLVLVMDHIAPDLARDQPSDYVTIRGDMLMLTAAGGRERTLGEFEGLFARAGLKLRRVVPTASGFAVLEAAPE